MADGGDLTQEQTEKLVLFREVSGIDDLEHCKAVLQETNWDMEVAVQRVISEQEGMESIFHERPLQPELQRDPPVDASPADQRVYVVNQWPQGLRGWITHIALFPFRFTYSTLWSIMNFALSLFRPDPRTVVTDPLGDVTDFIRQFNEKYGDVHPVLFHGTYSQALNEAKRELKFLLVYLHSDDHQNTDNFCRNTLCNQSVVDFINAQTVFWACSVSTPEGYRVSQALKENTYPFLGLIVLRQNRMTVVARIEGPIDERQLCTRLRRVMDDNEGSLHAARMDREERSFNQSLREQQDVAYLESLRADQEKERLKQEALERERQSTQQALDEEMKEIRRREAICNLKETLRSQLPAEPDADNPDAVRIVLKLPNGIRLERRFAKTESLQSLFNFVFVHEAAPDDFQIVTNFPRRVLPGRLPSHFDKDLPSNSNSVEPPTFIEFGLGRSEVLFVHDNEA